MITTRRENDIAPLTSACILTSFVHQPANSPLCYFRSESARLTNSLQETAKPNRQET